MSRADTTGASDEPVSDVQGLRSLLGSCDELSQEGFERVTVLAKSAKALLAIDANAICNVARLLDMIIDTALVVQNDINCEAETGGANFKNESERAFESRIWDQYHALKKGGAA